MEIYLLQTKIDRTIFFFVGWQDGRHHSGTSLAHSTMVLGHTIWSTPYFSLSDLRHDSSKHIVNLKFNLTIVIYQTNTFNNSNKFSKFNKRKKFKIFFIYNYKYSKQPIILFLFVFSRSWVIASQTWSEIKRKYGIFYSTTTIKTKMHLILPNNLWSL